MAIASSVVYGARALAGAAAGSSDAVASQNFPEKVRPRNEFCSLRCCPYRGEGLGFSSSPRKLVSVVASRAVPRAKARTSVIQASSAARFETDEDFEVDFEVERKRPLRPVVERFKIHHEKNVTPERLKELGVERWSKWECGPGVTGFWKWKVDEMVYISKGSVEVVPDGCWDGAFFYAGDIVRFPKWLEANLNFHEEYEQHYKFFAYGD